MVGFPWGVFSANTLRPMVSDILRAGGQRQQPALNKEQSLKLLQNIEKHGLDAALKDLKPGTNAASVSAPVPNAKRKLRAEPEADADADVDADGEASEPARKKTGRGRAAKQAAETALSAPPAPRTRGRDSDAGEGRLLTRHQAAQAARGENLPPARSWKPAARSARKASQSKKAGGSATVNSSASAEKPKSKGPIFDGVEIMKRPRSYAGKGKGREVAEPVGDEDAVGSDEDAEGEIVDDAIELETSSLENSNKENEVSLLEIANMETDPEMDDVDADADADNDALVPDEIEIGSPAPQIGSPAPQITVEPTDDQIEEARLNHDISIDIGSPAPEITIEPMADDGEEDEVQFEENGNGVAAFGAGLLLPRIDTGRAGTPLNPEYSIEVFSPTSAQHDSDDEMWVSSGINGSSEGSPAGGGLAALD
ncbi:hypothetical protein C8F04DRAFT_1140930 [Mycena alexandri]|uniref:Uncharacterized protein n=1 Tax=Mycena alexandri TaxID=1745969 RepID=A0AAD6WUI1_9AGAR|nr:hypothetical protein C8F04DRAFT_1140930 [Mycena alexandri]